MTRRIALGLAFAATILVAARSAATVPSGSPTASPPAAGAPSEAPRSQAVGPTPSVSPQSLPGAATTQLQVVHVLENPLDWADVSDGKGLNSVLLATTDGGQTCAPSGS
jgi:hypothetical protein